MWTNFLNSLATRGGAIFLLTAIFATGVCVSIHLIHHGEAGGQLAATLMGSFSSFSGALLLALKGSSESSATATTGPSGTSVTVGDAVKTEATVAPVAANDHKQE